ncbi:unnamed protein product [Callosobruchus maculatus]|uniref:SWIM-type domain-containing protein n=1 Tax=Callosobruchus maculatus TaxID=64391 RepID=A0A653CBF3_CALMS|nr:unnamed protein product [Callosobruchus maculatus]
MKLSIIEYMNYIGGSKNSKCVEEGESILNEQHLILAGKVRETSCADYITLYGLCLQTNAPNLNPYEITGKLLLGTSVTVSSMLCTCKDGNSGKCKHVSAFLLKYIREDVETLEVISETDKKWVTQRDLMKDVPVAEMPCFSGKIKKTKITIDADSVLDFFCRNLPTSTIAMHRKGNTKGPSTNTVVEEMKK